MKNSPHPNSLRASGQYRVCSPKRTKLQAKPTSVFWKPGAGVFILWNRSCVPDKSCSSRWHAGTQFIVWGPSTLSSLVSRTWSLPSQCHKDIVNMKWSPWQLDELMQRIWMWCWMLSFLSVWSQPIYEEWSPMHGRPSNQLFDRRGQTLGSSLNAWIIEVNKLCPIVPKI